MSGTVPYSWIGLSCALGFVYLASHTQETNQTSSIYFPTFWPQPKGARRKKKERKKKKPHLQFEDQNHQNYIRKKEKKDDWRCRVCYLGGRMIKLMSCSIIQKGVIQFLLAQYVSIIKRRWSSRKRRRERRFLMGSDSFLSLNKTKNQRREEAGGPALRFFACKPEQNDYYL